MRSSSEISHESAPASRWSPAGCASHIAPYHAKHRTFEKTNFGTRTQPAHGSLYAQGEGGLFEDPIAGRVGDILVIKIDEKDLASHQADTKLDKSDATTYGMPNALGFVAALQKKYPGVDPTKLFSSTTDQKFTGTGRRQPPGPGHRDAAGPRRCEVLPSGDLVVEGTKVVMVGAEEHHIYMSGVVRRIDIAQDDTVPSSRIADAEIEYTGRRRHQRYPAPRLARSHHEQGLAVLMRNLILILALLARDLAHADRIKDLASIDGVRDNHLTGFGIVVGLDGTGDDVMSPVVKTSLTTMLKRLGLTIDPTTMKMKNVAAVMLTAELPAFGRPGQKIDVTISSMGNAKSLSGGTLLAAPLKGPDGKTWGIAQGALVDRRLHRGRRERLVDQEEPHARRSDSRRRDARRRGADGDADEGADAAPQHRGLHDRDARARPRSKPSCRASRRRAMARRSRSSDQR